MQLSLSRFKSDAVSTVGRLSIDGVERCVTLEDGFHVAKIAGETRIPAGRYEIKLRMKGGMSASYLRRFGEAFHKGMLWLQNIPNFEFVYIHIGNTIADTEGCILVGKSASNHVAPARGGYTISESEVAYRDIYVTLRDKLVAGEQVFIAVKDEPAPDPGRTPLIA